MNISKLQNKLNKRFNKKVKVSFINDTLFLTGEVDSYGEFLDAGFLIAKKGSKIHVVNNIIVKGLVKDPIRTPLLKDNTLDNKHVDVLVIGGGVIGSAILRELSKYNLKTLLIDKEADLANQASGRNDGEVHPGVDLPKGTLKQSLVVKGNRMFDEVCKDLDVPFKRPGQIACFTQELFRLPVMIMILLRKYHCGVDDTKFVGKKFIKEKEPNYNPKFKYGIYNPMAGIVSPYELTIAYAENAVENGAEVSLNTICESFELKYGSIISVKTNRGIIYPKYVINAAGVFSDDIAEMANDKFFSIHPRRGTDIIMDKKASIMSSSIASIKEIKKVPKEQKHTKGGGTMPTVHGNILLGPDAQEIPNKEDYATYMSGLNTVFNKQSNTSMALRRGDTIAYFSGVRAATYEEDFIIEKGRKCKNIYHVAGIQSPGLTCAPAIGVMVAADIAKIFNASINKSFNPKRKCAIPHLNEMDDNTRDKYIKKNPNYGEMVCRCEEISKGEIIDALNSPIKVATIDGIKRRLRPGMGRCQGSFCMPIVAKIIAEHENIELKDVLKRSEISKIGYSNLKENIHYE